MNSIHHHIPKTTLEAVEIWFPIASDPDHYPKSQEWEQLWGLPTSAGYQIDNVPFFVKDIARGDIVSAITTNNGWLKFDRVVKPSGNSTFRIWLDEDRLPSRESVITQLREMGCAVEITLEQLLAIDSPPEFEEQVWNYLQEGLKRNDWELQVGCSPE